jgi:hypothetical protein
MADTGRKPSGAGKSEEEPESETDSEEELQCEDRDSREVDTYIPPARSGVSFAVPLPKDPRVPGEFSE